MAKRPDRTMALFLLACLFTLLGERAGFAQTYGSTFGVVFSDRDLDAALAAQAANQDILFRKTPGVLAIGIGLADDNKHPAIHIYFDDSLPSSAMRGLPKQLAGVAVTVFPSKPFAAFSNHQAAYSFPVPMGVSTSDSQACYAGTLGYRVVRKGDVNTVGYITNAHVAAAGSDFCPGTAPFGESQIQPGTLDAGCSVVPPTIGALVQYVPLVLDGNFINSVDAAFVSSDRRSVAKTILDLGAPSNKLVKPKVGLTVKKSGRSTGTTSGTISTINASVSVSYGSCGTGLFIGQMIVGPSGFSAAGDSGSPVLTTQVDSAHRFKPIGLLFAGNGSVTIMNRLDNVLGALNADIDTH